MNLKKRENKRQKKRGKIKTWKKFKPYKYEQVRERK